LSELQKKKKIKGRKADCILAAYYAAEAALRLIKPGETNTTVTEIIDRIANVFHCKPIEGMISYQMARGIIDGEKKKFIKIQQKHNVVIMKKMNLHYMKFMLLIF